MWHTSQVTCSTVSYSPARPFRALQFLHYRSLPSSAVAASLHHMKPKSPSRPCPAEAISPCPIPSASGYRRKRSRRKLKEKAEYESRYADVFSIKWESSSYPHQISLGGWTRCVRQEMLISILVARAHHVSPILGYVNGWRWLDFGHLEEWRSRTNNSQL